MKDSLPMEIALNAYTCLPLNRKQIMTFPPVSKTAWLRQVEQDLKGKPLSSIAAEWWPGEPIDPLLDISDAPTVVRLPDEWFIRPPSVVEALEPGQEASPSAFNHRILQSLQHGAEVLRIRTKAEHLPLTEAWLDGVETGFIKLQWEIDGLQPANLPASTRHLPTGSQFLIGQSMLFGTSHDETVNMIHAMTDLGFHPVIRFVVEPASPSSDAHKVLFARLGRLVKEWNGIMGNAANWFDHVVVAQTADSFYFRQVILSRAIQLVLRQLVGDPAGSPDTAPASPLEVDVARPHDMSPDDFLIRAAAAAVGAGLAGAGALNIEVDATAATAAHHRRAGLHIHHLLAMESQFMKGTDPLAGAYAIDHYTQKWAQGIWQAIHAA